MPSPPIQVFLTTIASQPALRQRQELLLRTLQVKKIPYTAYDLASDDEAKRLWRRAAPADKQQLPGILVGGKCPGTFAEFEDAVEYDELSIFLRLNDKWDPAIDEVRPALTAKPIGVPGASPSSTPLKLRVASTGAPSTPTASPLKSKGIAPETSAAASALGSAKASQPTPVNKREGEKDMGDELSGFGLQGVKATDDELLALVEELGLGKDEADELVKGLSGDSNATTAHTREA